MSSIDKKIRSKNSSSGSLSIFSSLSFNSLPLNSIKSFSNSQRLLFSFKNMFIRVLFKYLVSIFSLPYFGHFTFSILIYIANKCFWNIKSFEKQYLLSNFIWFYVVLNDSKYFKNLNNTSRLKLNFQNV